MADPRPQHSHVSRSIYSSHGPQQVLGNQIPHDRPMTTTMRFAKAPPEPPASISEHISQAVDRIPGLTARQKNSVIASIITLTRDISFLKLCHDQVGWARGTTVRARCRNSVWKLFPSCRGPLAPLGLWWTIGEASSSTGCFAGGASSSH
jgi:hypothetical protein